MSAMQISSGIVYRTYGGRTLRPELVTAERVFYRITGEGRSGLENAPRWLFEAVVKGLA